MSKYQIWLENSFLKNTFWIPGGGGGGGGEGSVVVVNWQTLGGVMEGG